MTSPPWQLVLPLFGEAFSACGTTTVVVCRTCVSTGIGSSPAAGAAVRRTRQAAAARIGATLRV